jgi:hypothetical protein
MVSPARAFSGEVDTGSPQKMRPSKEIERFHDSTQHESALEPYPFGWNQNQALAFCLSMIFSDLPSPAEAGFAKAGNRFPPRIKSGAGFFGIMLWRRFI